MLSPGTRIDDRYEVIDALGSGGMGHVYRARRLRLGDEVAIKVMQTTPDASPDLHERFLRESRACAQLRHPNIVGILDFGVDGSKQPYMAMELLSGPSLREEIELEAPMPPSRVAAILGPVAPEILMGGPPSPRADVFTIGVIAYQMVTGQAAFRAPSLPELIGQMLQAKPTAPSALNSAVPAAASGAILRAIDSAPANRFESADAFLGALDA